MIAERNQRRRTESRRWGGGATACSASPPGDSQHIVFTNHIGHFLIKELRANSDRWVEYRKYDANGRQIERAQPSAVVDYDEQHADLDVTLHPVWKHTEFRHEDGSGAVDTGYAYEWRSESVAMQQRATTLPAVPASQNGSDTSATRLERFDAYGNLVWVKDERGYLTRHTYLCSCRLETGEFPRKPFCRGGSVSLS